MWMCSLVWARPYASKYIVILEVYTVVRWNSGCYTLSLMCRVKANQYRSVDLRMLQAVVQLTCHKWSLKSQTSSAHRASYLWSYKLLTDSDHKKWLTDNPHEIPMNKTCFFPSQTCRAPQKLNSSQMLEWCCKQTTTFILYPHTQSTIVPDLLQRECTWSGVVLRSFLGGQQSSAENEKWDTHAF